MFIIIGIEQYKLEIFAEAILPYLEDMKSRFHIDQMRVQQVKSLLSIISYCAPTKPPAPMGEDGTNNNNAAPVSAGFMLPSDHPADTLLKIDEVLEKVKSGIWTSQLNTLLAPATNKQWLPIIRDNQRMLKNVGSKLLGLGMAEMLYRPVLMLYPMYMFVMSAMTAINAINTKKTIKPDMIVQVIKVLILSRQACSIAIIVLHCSTCRVYCCSGVLLD
jgi:hypothetical protein